MCVQSILPCFWNSTNMLHIEMHLLFPDWFPSLKWALVPLLVTLSTESSVAYLTGGLPNYRYWWFSSPLFSVVFKTKTTRFPPCSPWCCNLSYHSPIFMSFKSLLMTSFHLLFGPDCGRGWHSHPKKVAFGILLSCMHARWPSHCSLHFVILSEAVSQSPHFLLISDN